MKEGEPAIFHTSVGRNGAPKWRGPTVILDIDDTGVAAEFQTQTPKVVQYCVRRRVDPKAAGNVGSDLESGKAFSVFCTGFRGESVTVAGEDRWLCDFNSEPSAGFC